MKASISKSQQSGFALIIIVIAVLVLIGVGGGAYFVGKNSASKQNFSQNAVQPENNQSTQPQSSGSPGQILGGNGPQNDQTYITFSSDGKTWVPGNLIAEHASVPDIIQLSSDVGNFKKGDLLVYYIDFSGVTSAGSEQIAVISSSNGKTWSDKTHIVINNKPNKGAAVDPAIVQLTDGSLRLYYFGSEVTQTGGDPGRAVGPHKVYSATSNDGVNFEAESGYRVADDNLTDPEVIYYNNSWYLYYSVGEQFKLITSSDGLSFTTKTVNGADFGGVPGALAMDGGVRIWACKQGLAEGFAKDGANFSKESGDIFNGKIEGAVCDPSVVKLSDGRYAMVYKVRQGGQGQNQGQRNGGQQFNGQQYGGQNNFQSGGQMRPGGFGKPRQNYNQ